MAIHFEKRLEQKNARAVAGESDSAKRQGIRVIARAAAVLRALERHPEGLTLGEIANLVSLPRSTVQRIVDALDREHFVIAASASGGVRLGPALIALAASTRLDIAEYTRPALVQLAKELGETVDLSVLAQDKVVFIDQIPGTHRLRAVSAVGISFPPHCTASGKALLAALPEPQLQRLKKRLKLSRLTKSSIVTWDELDRELESIRKRGIAYDREEHSIGICAVGAAIRYPTGELAAVSIPVPTQRFAASEKRLAKVLVERCQTLQNRLER
jgi:IclR family acetate operon transcriptional repressor